ncbi:uncharacterized protein LOC5507775 [Nematostella vectensis]|uniref:uncharacterized protein LOC5507775 n=1 Tax=Nematostella vectensis TaxID=45351 RepID=UPI0020774AD8|nr:uncharacterized protein LOC5507775 [Nematostella vectensis]
MDFQWTKLLLLYFSMLKHYCVGLPSPVGLYPLDGDRKASDISCHNNPEGKLYAVKVSKGPGGRPSGAYRFSGSKNSYIEIPGNSMTDVRYSLTLLAEVYHAGYAGPIMDFATDGLGVNLWMTGPETLNGRFITRDGVNNIFLSSNQIGLRYSWHIVGLTYDYVHGTAELYIDGKRVRRLYLGRFDLKTKGFIRLGAVEHDDRYFKGKISCLQIYDKALSEKEIIEVAGRCAMKEPVNCSVTDLPSRVERHMTSSSGSFSSPGYPRGYPADANCVWTIKVPVGKRVEVIFSNLDLEQDSSCPDNVRVLDGLTSWSVELRRFCHSTEGASNRVTSSANGLRIEFRSNGLISGKGFTASYTSQDIERDDETLAIDLSIHYTGIVIGVACAALFTVLSIIAVNHTRRHRHSRRSSTFSDRQSECPSEMDVVREGAPPSYDIVMRCPDLYPPSPLMSPASSCTPDIQPRFKVPSRPGSSAVSLLASCATSQPGSRTVSPLVSRASSPVLSAHSQWNSDIITPHENQLASVMSSGILTSTGHGLDDDEDPPPYPGIVVVHGDTVFGSHPDDVTSTRFSTQSLHTGDMRGLFGSRTARSGIGYFRTHSTDLCGDHRLREYERAAVSIPASGSSPGLTVTHTSLESHSTIESNELTDLRGSSGNSNDDMRVVMPNQTSGRASRSLERRDSSADRTSDLCTSDRVLDTSLGACRLSDAREDSV